MNKYPFTDLIGKYFAEHGFIVEVKNIGGRTINLDKLEKACKVLCAGLYSMAITSEEKKEDK